MARSACAIDEQIVMVMSPVIQRSLSPSPLRSDPDPLGQGVVATKFGGAAFMIPNDCLAAFSAAVHRARSFAERVDGQVVRLDGRRAGRFAGRVRERDVRAEDEPELDDADDDQQDRQQDGRELDHRLAALRGRGARTPGAMPASAQSVAGGQASSRNVRRSYRVRVGSQPIV